MARSRARHEPGDLPDEGEDEQQDHVHGGAGQGDQDIVHLPGPRIGQGDLDRLAPTKEPERKRPTQEDRQEDHDARQHPGAEQVGMGQRVQGDAALGARQEVAA